MVVTQRQVLSFYCWLPQDLSKHGTAFYSLHYHYVIKTVFPPPPPPPPQFGRAFCKTETCKEIWWVQKGESCWRQSRHAHYHHLCWQFIVDTLPYPPPPHPLTHTHPKGKSMESNHDLLSHVMPPHLTAPTRRIPDISWIHLCPTVSIVKSSQTILVNVDISSTLLVLPFPNNRVILTQCLYTTCEPIHFVFPAELRKHQHLCIYSTYHLMQPSF